MRWHAEVWLAVAVDADCHLKDGGPRGLSPGSSRSSTVCAHVGLAEFGHALERVRTVVVERESWFQVSWRGTCRRRLERLEAIADATQEVQRLLNAGIVAVGNREPL